MFALFAIGESVIAQNVTVPDVEAVPGETVSFSVNLSEGKADTYTAMTIYAQFPATGFTTTGAYTISSSWTGASAVVGEVDGAGLATIPFASSNAIPGTSVDNLVTVSFTVDADQPLGDYDVTLKGTMFEYGTSDKDYAADVTFQVHVVSAHTIVLDENSTTVPTDATDVNVRVLRTISAGNWNTICLPFSMSEAQVKTAFGDDVILGDFVKYDTEEDALENITGINVVFTSATAIEANHPYIIKVSSAITNFTVDGVDIASDEDEAYTEYNNGKTGTKKVIFGTFNGTLHAGLTLANNQIFLADNKFWYSKGLTTIKAFRAYFDFEDVLASVESSAPLFISFMNTTGINEMNINEKIKSDGNYYDMQGRKVASPQKGLYILNNKKIVVK